jgi:hypothetical protein
MELSELQNLWLNNDQKLKENLRLNREILKQLLQKKPERRISWIKFHSIFNLILPLVIIPIFITQVKFRDEPSFYIGVFLFGSLCTLTYIWAIMYFLRVIKINFTNPIILLKQQIAELEKSKLKTTRIGYLLVPFILTGVYLIADIKIQKITLYSMLPLFLTFIVFASSVYITFKYTISERFRKLNQEIAELEKLMDQGRNE